MASAEEPEPAPSPSPQPSDDGPSKRTELVELRSESTKHFQEPDGTYTAEIYAAPVHFKDGESKWRNIETMLVPADSPGYAWRMKAGPVEVEFADAARETDTLRISKGAQTFTVGPVNPAAAQPVVEGSRITYPAIWPGVDLRYTLSLRGIKEDLVLHQVPGQNHFDFRVGGTLNVSRRADGGLTIKTSAGVPVYTTPPPVMAEADSADRPEPALSDDLSFAVSGEPGDQIVELSFDQQWVASPDRVWPILVDPSTTINPSPDTFVHNSYQTTNFNTEEDLRVGRYDTG